AARDAGEVDRTLDALGPHVPIDVVVALGEIGFEARALAGGLVLRRRRRLNEGALRSDEILASRGGNRSQRELSVVVHGALRIASGSDSSGEIAAQIGKGAVHRISGGTAVVGAETAGGHVDVEVFSSARRSV